MVSQGKSCHFLHIVMSWMTSIGRIHSYKQIAPNSFETHLSLAFSSPKAFVLLSLSISLVLFWSEINIGWLCSRNKQKKTKIYQTSLIFDFLFIVVSFIIYQLPLDIVVVIPSLSIYSASATIGIRAKVLSKYALWLQHSLNFHIRKRFTLVFALLASKQYLQ